MLRCFPSRCNRLRHSELWLTWLSRSGGVKGGGDKKSDSRRYACPCSSIGCRRIWCAGLWPYGKHILRGWGRGMRKRKRICAAFDQETLEKVWEYKRYVMRCVKETTGGNSTYERHRHSTDTLETDVSEPVV